MLYTKRTCSLRAKLRLQHRLPRTVALTQQLFVLSALAGDGGQQTQSLRLAALPGSPQPHHLQHGQHPAHPQELREEVLAVRGRERRRRRRRKQSRRERGTDSLVPRPRGGEAWSGHETRGRGGLQNNSGIHIHIRMCVVLKLHVFSQKVMLVAVYMQIHVTVRRIRIMRK